MSDRRRVAVRNCGAFYGTSITPIPTPMNALIVGPGEPGPGDEWRVPTGPLDADDGKNELAVEPVDAILEPVHSDGTVVLPLHPTDKG